MVFIYCLLSYFSDAAYSEHSYLVEIVVERTIFECNIHKSVPRSLQLKNIWYLQEQKYVVDIWNCNGRFQRLVNEVRQVTRIELKIFTRFAFRLVFRVSGRRVPWDKPPTSKRTDVHNLHVIFKCCL